MRKGYDFGQALLVLLTGPTHSAAYGFGFGLRRTSLRHSFKLRFVRRDFVFDGRGRD